MKVWIGTSGWQYYHWLGKFYPQDLKARDFLTFYARYFNTVEVNSSFYHFIREKTCKNWLEQVYQVFKTQRQRKNFLFSIKLHRLFTHFRKLKLTKNDKNLLKETLKTYLTLSQNLGPVLIQLPPSFKKDLKTLKNFLITLRKITKKIKFAVEFRHKSWLDKNVYKLLKQNRVAFVISDSPRWPTDFVKTTDFVYIRLHGKPKLFASNYSNEDLKEWVKIIKNLKPKIAFVYFNNDAEGYAVNNAFFLKNFLENSVN